MKTVALIAGFLLALAATCLGSSDSGYVPRSGVNPYDELMARIKLAGPSNFSITDKLNACWKDSFGRGVGRPIHSCPNDKEKDAGLCYDHCREGYTGVGPVCWEDCKAGWDDTGAFCQQWADIISADNDDCPWYDICGLTFEKGCSHCPDGYKNDGCTCRIDPKTYTKDSYGRGVGKPMGCASHEEYDAGLCYDPCPKKYYGVGPVCWQECPRARPLDWGAVCCTDEESCSNFIKTVSKATIGAVASILEAVVMPWTIPDVIKEAIQTAGSFVLFSCKKFAIG